MRESLLVKLDRRPWVVKTVPWTAKARLTHAALHDLVKSKARWLSAGAGASGGGGRRANHGRRGLL